MLKLTTRTHCRCGAPVVITEPYPGVLEAKCSGCYDGSEDAGPVSGSRGHGATPTEALLDWCQFSRGWRHMHSTQDDNRPFLDPNQ